MARASASRSVGGRIFVLDPSGDEPENCPGVRVQGDVGAIALEDLRECLGQQAMEAKPPAMHRRMRANGSLRAELEQRVALGRETYELAIGAPDSLYRRATEYDSVPLRKEAMFNQATSAAAAQAIAIATEFPEESPNLPA